MEGCDSDLHELHLPLLSTKFVPTGRRLVPILHSVEGHPLLVQALASEVGNVARSFDFQGAPEPECVIVLQPSREICTAAGTWAAGRHLQRGGIETACNQDAGFHDPCELLQEAQRGQPSATNPRLGSCAVCGFMARPHADRWSGAAYAGR